VIEQSHRNPGFSGDAPHGYAGMPVPGEAGKGGGNQQVTTVFGHRHIPDG